MAPGARLSAGGTRSRESAHPQVLHPLLCHLHRREPASSGPGAVACRPQGSPSRPPPHPAVWLAGTTGCGPCHLQVTPAPCPPRAAAPSGPTAGRAPQLWLPANRTPEGDAALSTSPRGPVQTHPTRPAPRAPHTHSPQGWVDSESIMLSPFPQPTGLHTWLVAQSLCSRNPHVTGVGGTVRLGTSGRREVSAPPL